MADMRSEAESNSRVALRERLQTALFKIESENRGQRFLIIFMAAGLGFGVVSLFLPYRLWHPAVVEIRIAPQILFVAMMVVFVLSVYLVRSESESRKLRHLALQQALAAQGDRSASMFDPVTNVFTRAFLHDLLQREIARAERNGRPLTLIMCDVNNFKHVNDRYGHLMGDEVLGQIASILKECVRGCDHVVRYGGDEFLLILPETDYQGSLVVRERTNQRVAEWDRTRRVGDVPISVSMGMYLHAKGQTPEQDIAEADARMYLEKQTVAPRNLTADLVPPRN
jgi:diguanylate cyclase (GGDEF)-like protein